ncbi:MAG: DUF1838 family protein [Gammaproteobacteria bacterium]|nr:DUF1838 family protein [Gammaproteobacteria bacterium]
MQRRELLKSFASVGAFGAAAMSLGAASNAAAKASDDMLRGPFLDLTTGKGNKLAYARMQGDLEFGVQRHGWFRGYVTAVRPNAKIEDLFGFEGFGVARLEQRPDGSIARLLREVGVYTDLRSGEVLEEWRNPFLNETVRVVPVANDPFNFVIEEYFPEPPTYGGLNQEKPPRIPFVLPWRQRGDWLDMEIHIHLLYPNALQPDKWPRESAGPMARVSEFFAHHLPAADMQNPDLTSLNYHGVWNRVTPWLPWMLMGQQPGHCQYFCFMGKGDDLERVHSRAVLDYIEKNYPTYFDAPTEWVDPSLSSIERYALEQQPAPVND